MPKRIQNDNIHGDEHLDRELGQYECSCERDYAAEIAKVGYPKWRTDLFVTAPGVPLHQILRFVDDCSFKDCGRRVCHECTTTCKICGCQFCSDHTTDDMKEYGLCEQCLGDYCEISAGRLRDKLIEIEGRLFSGEERYYRAYGMRTDLKELLSLVKEALPQMVPRPLRVATRGADGEFTITETSEDICGLCGKPGADKIPHPQHWPGEQVPDTDLVHSECEQAECKRAHSLLSDKQRRAFLGGC